MDFSFLPVYALLLSVIIGFGSLFGFLRLLWKDINGKFKEFQSELKSDISGLRTELKSDISGLRTELKSDISELRTEFKIDIQRVDKNIFYLRKRMDVLVDSLALRFLASSAAPSSKNNS
ncbi:DUF1640 domain-containing protein [Leptospira sp. WS92.C1]